MSSSKDFIEGFFTAKAVIVESQTAWVESQNLPPEIEELLMKIVSIGDSAELVEIEEKGA